MARRAWTWVAALGVGVAVGVLLLGDRRVVRGVRALRAIAEYCPCNQAVEAVEPGMALAEVEALVGDRLRALDEDGRLQQAVAALGEDRALWLGERLVVDCRRPSELGGRRGVVRSYAIELDGDGRVRRVVREGLAYWGCAGDEGDDWLRAAAD